MSAVEDQIPPLSDRELLVRIDTKLDGVIEAKKDHEERLRTIEDKIGHFVSGKQLWAGFAAVLASGTGAVSLINWLTHH